MTDPAGSPDEALARERVLGRVRAAIGGGQRLGDQVDAEYAALPRRYLRAHHDPASHDIVSLFAERAADYRAVVERVSVAALPGAIARVVAARAGELTTWKVAIAKARPRWKVVVVTTTTKRVYVATATTRPGPAGPR